MYIQKYTTQIERSFDLTEALNNLQSLATMQIAGTAVIYDTYYYTQLTKERKAQHQMRKIQNH